MKRPLHVACSPLTKTIYAGSVSEDAKGIRTWLSNRTEVTMEAIGAVIEHIEPGHVLTVHRGDEVFEVEIRRITPLPDKAPEETSERRTGEGT